MHKTAWVTVLFFACKSREPPTQAAVVTPTPSVEQSADSPVIEAAASAAPEGSSTPELDAAPEASAATASAQAVPTQVGVGQGIDPRRFGTGHPVRPPQVRLGPLTVNGRLPPEVIQRIVRQNLGRFKLCYENGLRNNPSLQGRVGVKFVIDRAGEVSTAGDGGSDLPDQNVVQCVIRGFGNLSFPQPEGGIVTVVAPVIFTPGDQ